MYRPSVVPVYARGSHLESLHVPGVLEGAYRVAIEKFEGERPLAMVLLTECKIWDVVLDAGALPYLNCPLIGEIEL